MTQKVKTRKDYSKATAGSGDALDPLRDFEGGPVEKALFQLGTFIRDRLKETIMIIAGSVLIVSGIIGYYVWVDYRDTRALEAFENMMDNPVMNPAVGSSEKALEKLQSYMEEYSSEKALNRAALEKIQIYDREMMYEKAGETSAIVGRRVGDNYLKAYFFLQAAIYYEMAGNFTESLEFYQQAQARVKDSNLLKAMVLYGEGRSLIQLEKKEEGRKKIRQMMELEGVEGLEEFRISATAYLLSN